MPSPWYVGIDVSKDTLEVAPGATATPWRVSYDEGGVAERCRRLRALAPELVVLEASGGYERVVGAALAAAGLPAAVVNPRQTRDGVYP